MSGSPNTYRVLDAGTVRIARSGDDELRLVSARPRSGWRARVEERRGDDVEVDFVRGSRKAEFEAEIDDERIEVECDRDNDRDDDEDDDGRGDDDD